ncbi:MAG: glycoside hydrolase family 97 C-terminal domain-containing protein [Kiritimatiellia bacterium]
MNKNITVESPDKRIRAEISLVEFWCDNTVYPSAAVLRITFRGYPVVQTEALRLNEESALYGLEFVGAEESHSEMRLGAAFQKVIHLRERGRSGRDFSVTLRLSDVSLFFDINEIGSERKNHTLLPCFADDAPLISKPRELPVVAYIGPGSLAAVWPQEGTIHLVISGRPGRLAEMHFALLDSMPFSRVKTGSDGCLAIYTQLPFVKNTSRKVEYSDEIRLSYQRAFDCLLEHYSENDEDFWVMRGDPGVFAVVARQVNSKWIVCGLTDAPRTLTIRFEELWLRLPPEMRLLKWHANIVRDPVLDEADELVEESFTDLAPDVRIALDLKRNGGFVIEFEPMKDM